MKKNHKEMFISFKKDEKSILVYPFKQSSWEMDSYTLGEKLSKKFPTHAQTVKVLSLMPTPFFYDFNNNKIKVILQDIDDFGAINKIVLDYFKGIVDNSISLYEFKNNYREDGEKMLEKLIDLNIIKIEQPTEETNEIV